LGVLHHPGNPFGADDGPDPLRAPASEAYNVEIGVTNELFPQERDETPGCQFNQLTEDATNLYGTTAASVNADIVNFAGSMRLLAPPTPMGPTADTERGRRVFMQAGCGLCHIPQHTTGSSIYTGQSNFTYSPFSDFALHDMGLEDADQVSQGEATGFEFRIGGSAQKPIR
jgi:CxxC motif-containing protein (DUF1111 family)